MSDQIHFQHLLDQVRKNQPQALGVLLQQISPYLKTLAQRHLSPQLKCKAGESDLVQETCSAAIEGIGNFEGTTEAEFRSWLASILINRAASHAQLYLHTGKRDIRREVPLESPSGNRKIEVSAPGLSPSKQVSRQEEREQAARKVAELPEAMREVVTLHFRDHLSFAEIASRIGKREDAVKKLWARAIIKLKGTPKVQSP